MQWLTIIGVGSGGVGALSAQIQARISTADCVIGAKAVIDTVSAFEGFKGRTHIWPKPFLDIIPLIEKYRGRAVVVLATGDPLWYGAGATLLKHFSTQEVEVIPSPSGFQLAAAKMGWAMAGVQCLTVHGRPLTAILPHLAPKAQLLILAHNKGSSAEIAQRITQAGFGEAVVTALGSLGSTNETRIEAAAHAWHSAPTPPDFHIIAIACPDTVKRFLPRTPGLPDTAFRTDGMMTKAEVRGITLARLAPHNGGVLWDLGCGSGSVGIEWMRSADNAQAIGVDKDKGRIALAQTNAKNLGVPHWQGICSTIDAALADLPDPDAIFIGGGLTADLVAKILPRLPLGGRLVANVVTLESEAVVLALRQEYGGELTRIAISRAENIAPRLHGWRPLMPVLQWVWIKGGGR